MWAVSKAAQKVVKMDKAMADSRAGKSAAKMVEMMVVMLEQRLVE